MLAYLQRGGQMVWSLIRPRKKLGWISFVFLFVAIFATVLVTTPAAFMGVWEFVSESIASLCLLLATLFMKLTIFVLTFIIQIAAYNGYLDSTAVNYGWVMVRDVTNMAFVVILLLIAFGTILGLEQYEWKKMMVKFVLAAILVNFSRVICGVIIDVGQVVMVTFINGVAATAGGNLITMFNMGEIMSLTSDAASVNSSEILMASVAAVGFTAMMLGTMVVFLIMLLARMLTLWVLIVLSPLAFVLSVIPQTQKYASEWWQNFGNNVVSGPVIAFFLWLAFVTVGGGNINKEIESNTGTDIKTSAGEADAVGEKTAGIGEAMSWDKMANFVIAIGMLLVGAKTAQQLGVTGGSMMSKATDFAKKAATIATGVAAGKWVYDKMGGAKGIGKAVGMNIPLVGGKAWVRRGYAVADKALQGAEWWNKKIGSRLGSSFQFGSHYKMMKERKEALDVRLANMSSSVKGFQGFQIEGAKKGSIWGKREGGVERYRQYTDEIRGRQMLNKEASEALRSSRKTAAQNAILNAEPGSTDYELREKFAERTTRNRLESTKLETGRAKVELDVVAGLSGGELGQAYTSALSEREIAQNALLSTRSLAVSEKTTETKREALPLDEAVADIAVVEGQLKNLEDVYTQATGLISKAQKDAAGKSGPERDAVNLSLKEGLAGLFKLLPKDLADKINEKLGEWGTDSNNSPQLGEAMRQVLLQGEGTDFATTPIPEENVLSKAVAAKSGELREKELTFGKKNDGGITIKGANFERQAQLLEQLKKEIAKEREQKGSGNFSFDGFADELKFMFGKDNIDAKFATSLQTRNIVAASTALKDMGQQKSKSGDKGVVSVSSAARAAGAKSVEAKIEVSGKITADAVSGMGGEARGALKNIFSSAGLKAEDIDPTALSEEKITEAISKITRGALSNPDLSRAGLTQEQIIALIKGDLKSDVGLQNIIREILKSS